MICLSKCPECKHFNNEDNTCPGFKNGIPAEIANENFNIICNDAIRFEPLEKWKEYHTNIIYRQRSSDNAKIVIEE